MTSEVYIRMFFVRYPQVDDDTRPWYSRRTIVHIFSLIRASLVGASPVPSMYSMATSKANTRMQIPDRLASRTTLPRYYQLQYIIGLRQLLPSVICLI